MMKHVTLVLVFVCGLLLKVSIAAGADVEISGDESQSGDRVSHYTPQSGASSSSSSSAAASAVVVAPAPAPVETTNINQNHPEQSTAIQNNNNITFGHASPIVQGPNQVGPAPRPQLYTAPVAEVAYAGTTEGAVVVARDREELPYWKRLRLVPMIGGTWWATRWRNHISNDYTLGLALEVPISPNFSFEVEGNYGDYSINYVNVPVGNLVNHGFRQFGLGSDLRVNLMTGTFKPYFGAGIMGTYFDGMHRPPNPYNPYPGTYSHWLGQGELLLGADIALTHTISIGARGAWLIPMFNRPQTMDNGIASLPGYEEAGAINTSVYRLMGAVSVAL